MGDCLLGIHVYIQRRAFQAKKTGNTKSETVV